MFLSNCEGTFPRRQYYYTKDFKILRIYGSSKFTEELCHYFVFSFDDILRYWHVNAFLLHPLFLLKTNKQHIHEFEEGYLNN